MQLKTPLLVLQLAILAAQSVVMIYVKNTVWMYVGEGALFALMLAVNARQLWHLIQVLADRFIRKKSV